MYSKDFVLLASGHNVRIVSGETSVSTLLSLPIPSLSIIFSISWYI